MVGRVSRLCVELERLGDRHAFGVSPRHLCRAPHLGEARWGRGEIVLPRARETPFDQERTPSRRNLITESRRRDDPRFQTDIAIGLLAEIERPEPSSREAE